jgi:protease-4
VVAISRLHIAGRAPEPVADNSVLSLTVQGPFTEELPIRTGFASPFTRRAAKLRDVIAAIDRAAKDSRVKGLVVKIDASPGLAQVQELRGAIARFRSANKFVYAYADDFGQGAPGNGQYALAAAADQIWIQPLGELTLSGITLEQPFFKDALARLDIEPEFSKRADYKTAPETFTEKGFTQPAREMMESLANDLTMQLVSDISQSRKLQPDDVRQILARGPLAAREAVEAKLIDHVGYADEVLTAARQAAGEGEKLVPVIDYASETEPHGTPNIALVYEVGTIGRASGPIDPTKDEHDITRGDTVLRGLAKAAADPSVKAIVLRVDSPGGSVSGSETVRRAVDRAKGAGKKIIVSMGATAASGGYWISVDADKIVADPATLTGSIGVFSGKFVVAKGLADIGVTTDRTSDGGFATMESPFSPFTPDQLQKLNASLDQIYDGFIARVAAGRKLPPAVVAQSAGGRVWTGQQAKERGLVDQLGGLTDAEQVAHDVAGIPADQPVVVAVYPKPLSPFAAVRELLTHGADLDEEGSAAIAGLDGPVGDLARALLPLFRKPEGAMAQMPDLGVMQ